MLTLAREFRGLTQTQLAKLAKCSQTQMSRYENESLTLSEETAKRFSKVLQFPVKFFEQHDTVYGLGASFVFHRKRQSMPAFRLRRVQAEINVAKMRIDRLLRGLDCEYANDMPTFEVHEDGTPEDIAQMVRSTWQLPSGPVRNLTRAIESAGAIVLSYPFGNLKIDGLSFWVPPTPPLFFLNDRAPEDRRRWTLAHELGHAVMHRYVGPDIEQEADRFSSEFLMPAAEIRGELHGLTLPKAASLKLTWLVSIQALVRRARDLGAITYGKYKSLCVQISRCGFRTREPNPLAPEQPQNLESILSVLRTEHGYDQSVISAIALAEPEDMALYFSANRLSIRIAT